MNSSPTSSWRCPVCKKRTVELIRDQLFEQAINLSINDTALKICAEEDQEIEGGDVKIANGSGVFFRWSRHRKAFISEKEWKESRHPSHTTPLPS
jgi:hypothetical protein